jgi:subtilisin family serine protease
VLTAAAAFPAAGSAIAPPKDRYIVVLKSGDPGAVAADHGRRYGATDRRVYRSALRGYAAKVPPGQVAALRRDPRVESVEADGIAHAVATQSPATWGLDRIDQRSLPLSGSYTYNRTGAGVTAYIIDTGIRTTHTDFGGRASRSAAADFVSPSTGGDDCDGHGTHVSGTVGGTTYGVAKGVTLKAVRVLDCTGSGYWSWVIAGIDYVTAQHAANTPAVANMSLGGGATTSVDDAVRNSIADGVTYSIAAGNSNRDACNYTPARVSEALTIGSTTTTDARSSFSNYGSCVDWFAPGSSITSDYNTSNTATSVLSGTSMASPHSTGAAALYLQGDPTASPAQVRSALFGALTTGVVTSSNSANNHLLYTGLLGADGPGNDPPVASFTTTCNGLSCTFNGSGSSDVDGTIESYTWDFGEGPVDSTSGAIAPHTYSGAGTYDVTLTVTDNATPAGSGSTSQSVTVSVPPPISLTASGFKSRGVRNVSLSWSPTGTGGIDVYRNGGVVNTVPNNGAYTDPVGGKGSGTFSYRVCRAGTSTCSNTATVVF